MYYTATSANTAVTMNTANGYKDGIAAGMSHSAAMRDIRRALIRAVVKADKSIMHTVHAAMRDAMDNAAAMGKRDFVTAAMVKAAGHAALASAVRIAPSTIVFGELYAPGMVRAALQVARKTLSRACEHGGTDTQRNALRELDRVNAAAVRYDVAGYSWEASTVALSCMLDCDHGHPTGASKQGGGAHDAADMYAAAMDGLTNGYTFEKGKHKGEHLQGACEWVNAHTGRGLSAADMREPVHRDNIRAAYLAANLSMHTQRAATVREMSTEYIREDGGDIVAIGTAIARIIKGGDNWTLSDCPPASRVTVETIREHLPRALALCRPVQRDIARLLAAGYSVDAIAHKMNRDRRTVQRNIAIMRGTCAEYIREHAPALLPMFNADKYAAAADAQEAAAHMPRTEAGKAAKKAADKATQAARARAYRERKKAEKEAAAVNK